MQTSVFWLVVLVVGGIALTAPGFMKATRRAKAEEVVNEFWQRAWTPPHDLSAVDDLVTRDFVITTGGTDIIGRDAFKAWIERFQAAAQEVNLEAAETFANADATRVTSRWQATALNNGVLGLEADGREITFTGTAVWEIRWVNGEPRLAHNWVERSAWEVYQQITSPAGSQP